MREYIVSILCAATLFAIISLLSYKNEPDKGMRIALAVLFVWVAFVPIAKNIGTSELKLPSFDIDISDYSEEYLEVAEKAFSDGVRSLVCDKFSLNESDVRVSIEGFCFEKMTAERIALLLSGRAVLSSYKDIEKYVEDTGLGECDVKIEITE